MEQRVKILAERKFQASDRHMNFMRLIACVCFAAALLSLSGCIEEDVPKNDYFPLRDGNHWEYRLLDRPLLGRLAAGHAIIAGPLDKENKEKIVAPRNKADLLDNIPTGETGETGEIDTSIDVEAPAEVADDATVGLKKREVAVARRVALDLQAAVDDLTFKATYDNSEQAWSKRDGYVSFQSARGRSYLLILPPHSTYRWVVSGSAGQNLYYEVETARGEVSVPAGKFSNCAVARSESRDKKEIFKYWFAPGVGLIRRSKYFAGEEVFRQELVDYKVLPAKQETRAAEDKEVRKAIEGKKRGNEFRTKESKEARATRLDDLEDLEKNQEKMLKYGSPK